MGQILLGEEVTPRASGSHFGNYINLRQPEYGCGKGSSKTKANLFLFRTEGVVGHVPFPFSHPLTNMDGSHDRSER